MRFFIFAVLFVQIALAAPPLIQDVSIESKIDLISGTTTPISCNATILDTDGDITDVNAIFYDILKSTHGSPDDENNHYTTMCDFTVDGNTTYAECNYDIEYYANAGSWRCTVIAEDPGNTDSGTIDTLILELRAVNVTEVHYDNGSGGPIGLGNLSGEVEMQIINLGNVDIGIEVSGTQMGCDSGTIDVRQHKYSTRKLFDWNKETSLTTTPTTIGKFSIPQRTDGLSLASLYWKIKLPSEGVGGDCDGIITVNAR